MRIQAARRLMTLKVVYYGPGRSGKTTNLRHLHDTVPESNRGALVTLDTETERTLYFDYFPAVLGTVGGFKVKVDFFTVPGQSFYQATRRAVLEGADAVVFVADSRPSREVANQVSRDDLVAQLASMGRSLDTLPHVYQWNKRDVPGAIPLSTLEATLNPEGAPAVPAIATNGRGVRTTQSLLLRQLLSTIEAQFAKRRRGGSRAAASAPPTSTSAGAVRPSALES